MSGVPAWFALGAAALTGAAALAWILRGPALILDLAWIGCF
jgi:hypothetical protein